MSKTPRMEPEPAPIPTPAPYIAPQPTMPRQKRIERQGDQTVPMVRRHPSVTGGVCEFCGILDKNTPSEYQYRLCPHYRGMSLRCTYCPPSKDPDQVVYHAKLNIYDHPTSGDLVVVCNSYDCTSKHQKRFTL